MSQANFLTQGPANALISQPDSAMYRLLYYYASPT